MRTLATRRRTLTALGVAASGLAGCLSGSGTPETVMGTADRGTDSLSGTIRIAGSSTVYPLTLAIGNAFTERHPDVTISATSTGTGGGFAEFFCGGRTDINDASRRITASEERACESEGVEPLAFRVATDALSVVVSNAAEWASCVTLEELAAVWREGGAKRWSDVKPSWPDEPVELYGPTSASGTFDYFSGAVLDGTAHRTDYQGTEEDSTVVESVRESPHAMGYFGFAYYARNRDAVRALSIRESSGDCVPPSLSNARTGAYDALSRPLFIYVSRDSLRRPAVESFVRFYLDRTTEDIVSDVGYAPVGEKTAARNRERFERAVSNAE